MVKAEKIFDTTDKAIEKHGVSFVRFLSRIRKSFIAWREKQYKAIQELNKTEYRLVEYINELTEEKHYYIESRIGKHNENWVVEKIDNPVYQQKFGCDERGMYGDVNKARHVLKFLRGDIKVTQRIIE